MTAQAPNTTQYLRLASFNVQTGIRTDSYGDYLLRGWQHLWPTPHKLTNLEKIAEFLRPFDIVGLQEVDGGGARSHYVIQTEYLARRAGFPYWHNQVNRRLGNLALHSNGLLSRLRPRYVHETPLPGLPGRGALLARFGDCEQSLHLCIVHLALSRRARMRQLAYIADMIAGLPQVVLMGDLNCGSNAPELQTLLSRTGLIDPVPNARTFPSWRPQRKLDHILVSPSLRVAQVKVYDFTCSDHLPIGVEVALPEQIPQAA